MIYPGNYEHKIGFDEIRSLLCERCLSSLGREKVDEIAFSTDGGLVREHLQQVDEFRRLTEKSDDFPLQFFFDVRESLVRIRLVGTHLEEQEVFDLRRSLETIHHIVKYLRKGEDEVCLYPALKRLTDDVVTFPAVIRRIDSILDKFGRVKDGASMTLSGIRHELQSTEGSISRTLYTILHAAQRDGLVDKDAAPTMRDGRLMIPVAPGLKRKINGIVHDESATGKTVFIEPAEVVEANNRIRQLEAEERREIVRILTVFTDEIRPNVKEMTDSYLFLATIDLIQAKARLAETMKAIVPTVIDKPHIDWIRAIHPLLAISLEKQGKEVVPLDIVLKGVNGSEGGVKRSERDDTTINSKSDVPFTPPSLPLHSTVTPSTLLIISGPNAGGKSVCLKTVGLLQYMLQCGLPIPMGERSTCGLFRNIMIDIGDEQSIEDDLSTYSSHLMNMKQMMRSCDEYTLLLIDEFGGGTEPTIGGAIAEAVLKQFWKKKTFGVITTHYQNLKHFADDHEGVVNGAMLYDRNEMRALFQLSIGQPGSSFAIEIARKTGLPEEVIQDASDIVGRDYIQSDKYLQDIVRDKRYWEGKRQTIHQHEKRLAASGERLEADIEELERERKAILQKAKEQAAELLREANKKIENAIREIREQQAEKEATRRIREEMEAFRQEISDIDQKAIDEKIERKMRQIQERKERKEKKRKEKAPLSPPGGGTMPSGSVGAGPGLARKAEGVTSLAVGDSVRIKGLTSVGTIEKIEGKMATVIFGDMRTKMRLERLEAAAPEAAGTPSVGTNASAAANDHSGLNTHQFSRSTREAIDERKYSFRQDLDVRGMRGDEAVNAVMYFIDDAILVGMSRVRILHGTGSGILRQLIRQYLRTNPAVISCRDEHVQFGGAGISVVDIG